MTRTKKVRCDQVCPHGPDRGAPPDFWSKVGRELCTKIVLQIDAYNKPPKVKIAITLYPR